MKPVKIQIAKNMGLNQPPKMLDWDGYETIIPGLYLTRPLMLNEQPAPKGWNVCHQKSGLVINSKEFKNNESVNHFIEILATKNLDWDIPADKIINNKCYRDVIKETYEELEIPQQKVISLPLKGNIKDIKQNLKYRNNENLFCVINDNLKISYNLLKSLITTLEKGYIYFELKEDCLKVNYEFGRATLKNVTLKGKPEIIKLDFELSEDLF